MKKIIVMLSLLTTMTSAFAGFCPLGHEDPKDSDSRCIRPNFPW